MALCDDCALSVLQQPRHSQGVMKTMRLCLHWFHNGGSVRSTQALPASTLLYRVLANLKPSAALHDTSAAFSELGANFNASLHAHFGYSSRSLSLSGAQTLLARICLAGHPPCTCVRDHQYAHASTSLAVPCQMHMTAPKCMAAIWLMLGSWFNCILRQAITFWLTSLINCSEGLVRLCSLC